MKKYLLMLLPLVAVLLAGCSSGFSYECIDAKYDAPQDGVLKAEGEKITIKVESTHSFVMTSDPQGVFSFDRNGVVKFDKEGIAIVEVKPQVEVAPNTTGEDRKVYINFTQRHNPEIKDRLIFLQPAVKNQPADDKN